MRQLFQQISRQLTEFEIWFERKFGWFFTNGMKQDHGARADQAADVPGPVSTKA